MNYTYIDPSSVYRPITTTTTTSTSTTSPSTTTAAGPGVIIMLLSPTTKKSSNLQVNPRVSLLVHDWISHRPSTSYSNASGTSPTSSNQPSSLAELLQNLNSSSLSTHSHTIRGYARIVEADSEEEKYYRQKHVEGNQGEEVRSYIEGDEGLRVVVVEVEGGRVADWKGGVNDWGLCEENSSSTTGPSGSNSQWLSNGQ